MNQIATVPKPLIFCSACGLPLKPRTTICPSCGSLAPLERVMAVLSRHRRTIGRDAVMRLQTIAWGLALTPLLFVPPLAAVLIAWRSPNQRLSERRFDPTWITIVAILNIVVSAGVIHRFGPDLSSFVARGQQMLGMPPEAPVSPGSRSI